MNLSPCAEIVRRHDNDRYLCALFAPQERREDLFALYAFNQELAKTRESVSEPMLGQIRLQWWRDAVEECHAGTPRRHEVVTPLAEAVQRCHLSRDLMDRLVEVRERDLDDAPPATLDELLVYCNDTAGTLAGIALGVLGVEDVRVLGAGRKIGQAWALIGLLRASAFLARSARTMLPTDRCDAHGLVMRDYRELRDHAGLRAVVAELAGRAEALLQEAAGVRLRAAAPVLLQASLARGHLKRLRAVEYNVFDPRLTPEAPGRIWRLAVRAAIGRY